MKNKTQESGWWIEILTNNPNYTYYFGPFNSYWKAEWSKNGYIQDLEQEKALIANVAIGKWQPRQLTFAAMPFSA